MIKIIKTLLVLALVLSFIVPAQAGKVYYDDVLIYNTEPSIFEKLVLYQYNQRGNIAGFYGTLNAVTDSSASFTFDMFGRIDFNSNGYGENDKITVQLVKETSSGRYFCTSSTCGGMSNWINDMGTVTAKPGFVLWKQTYTGLADGAFGTAYKAENFPCLAGRLGYNKYYGYGIVAQFSGSNGVSGAWKTNTEIDLFTAIKNAGIDASSICPAYYAPAPNPPPPTPPPTATPPPPPACNPGYQYSNGLCYPSLSPPSNPPIFDLIDWLKSIWQGMFGVA